MTIMIIISILIINWGCFSSRLHYCPRLGLLVHALGSPEQECNLHGLPSPASRCRRGNLYKNNYSYHQRYYYHYYHCLYEGRSGVPIHAKSPTPSLKNFVPVSILPTPCCGMASCKNNSPGHEQSAK